MPTNTDFQSSGIRDPYRSLLILSGGVLLALALFIGQAGYRDDPLLTGQAAQTSPAMKGMQVAR